MTRVFGFTLIRNGIKYDYSFRESLLSLSGVCEKTFLAVGQSEDGTEEAVAELPNIVSIPTIWDESLREGGLILSDQTNVALNALKKEFGDVDGHWGFYLQGDEVLHEEDYKLILEDFKKAQECGADAISFRYLHFWQDHHSMAINKKWYPQEIRGVKLKTPIESWGDAQSFRYHTKVYESEAKIFHYGHVREEDSYQEKKKDILKLYHSDEKISKYKNREKKFDSLTECIPFFGTHPALMKERIERLGDIWELDEVENVFIVGQREMLSEQFLDQIKAKEIHFVKKPSLIPVEERARMIILKPTLFQCLLYPSRVPTKMRSTLSREWKMEFLTILKLSERRIGLTQNSSD